VQNAVFHDRLQQQLQDVQLPDIGIGFQDQGDFLFEAQVLQGDIQPDMFQLIVDRDQGLAVAQAEPVKARQVDHDVAHLVGLLEHLELAVLEALAKFVLLVQQQADLADHHVEVALQLTDLVGAVDDAVDVEMAGLDDPHLANQPHDPAGIAAGVEPGQEIDDDPDQSGEKDQLNAQPGGVGQKRLDRRHHQNTPAAENGIGKAGQDRLVVHGDAGVLEVVRVVRDKIHQQTLFSAVQAANGLAGHVDDVGAALGGEIDMLQDIEQRFQLQVDRNQANHGRKVPGTADQGQG